MLSRSIAIAISLFLVYPNSANSSNIKNCGTDSGKFVAWIQKKALTSEFAEPLSVTCTDLRSFDQKSKGKSVLTTTRKGRKYFACLAPTKNDVCKVQLVQLNGFSTPQSQLLELVGVKVAENKAQDFNETLERLYLKPSNLIR